LVSIQHHFVVVQAHRPPLYPLRSCGEWLRNPEFPLFRVKPAVADRRRERVERRAPASGDKWYAGGPSRERKRRFPPNRAARFDLAPIFRL
jgi:hypothetical protein